MASKLAALVTLAASLSACESSNVGSCGERDISAWVPLSGFPVAEVRCDGKLVGYELNLPEDRSYRIWTLTNAEAHSVNGPLQIAADIDLVPEAVERVAKLARGSAVYDERNAGSLTVQASATALAGPMLREFAVKIPAGSAYRGQIRNLKW